MKATVRSRRVKGRHTRQRREPPLFHRPEPKPKPKLKTQTETKKMAEKKEPEKELFPKEEEEGGEKPVRVQLVGTDQEPVPVRRSDTEQSIIDSYGTDPEKHKEGTRERELVDSLPENVAAKRKKQEEEEAKKKKK